MTPEHRPQTAFFSVQSGGHHGTQRGTQRDTTRGDGNFMVSTHSPFQNHENPLQLKLFGE